MDSQAAARNRANFLQFSYYDPTLPTRLAADVARSSFTTRPKYLNALIEKVLSSPMKASTLSHIDEFFAWIALFESLPTERIRQLAPTQNRNFEQMFKHLLEIALSYYPEPRTPVVERDTRLQIGTRSPELADYGLFASTNYRPSPIYSPFA